MPLFNWFLTKGFGSDKLHLLAHLRALDLMQYFLASLSETLAKKCCHNSIKLIFFVLIMEQLLFLCQLIFTYIVTNLFYSLNPVASTFCCNIVFGSFFADNIFLLGILVFFIFFHNTAFYHLCFLHSIAF